MQHANSTHTADTHAGPAAAPGVTAQATATHGTSHETPAPGSHTGMHDGGSPVAPPGLQAMADALVAAGKLSREQASQMLHAEMAGADAAESGALLHGGHPPHGTHGDAQSAPPSAASNNTESEGAHGDDAPHPTDTPLADIEIDPLFAPPPTPEGYTLELNPAVPATVEEVAAVRQWFHTLRLPQPIAQSLYSEVERMSQRPPGPAEIDRMTMDTSAQLRRTWGERTDTMLGHARRLIDEAARTHPHLKTTLARGPGSNPLVVRQLAEHAARLYGRGAAGAPMQSNTYEGDN